MKPSVAPASEEKEREALRQYPELVHSLNGIVWEVDAKDFRFTFVSPQCERLLGYSQERWLKEVTWKRLIHPEDFDRVLAVCTKAVEEKRDHTLEYRVVAADGRVVWTRNSASVIVEDGQPVKIRGVLLDITERKRAESLQGKQNRVLEMIATGRPQEEVLTAIVRVVEEHFPTVRCSILLADKEGKHLRSGAAPSFPEEFNRAVDGLAVGPSAGSCGTAAYRRETVIVEDVTTDPLFAGFRELVLKNRIRACWSLPLLSAGDQVLGTICMYYPEPRRPTEPEKSLMDTAARMAAIAIEHYRIEQAKTSLEVQLRQSQKLEAIGTLAGGVAHELNNPLQAIVNYSALLKQRIQHSGPGTTRTDGEGEANARMVADIHEAALRCAKIVRNLLAFARKEVQQKTTMDVNEIIRRTSEFLAHTLSLNKVQLEVQLADNLPQVLGNPLALQQAFTNLILNARDAMPEGGTVTLATRQVNGHVEASVKDQGTGMAPDALSHLFEPFFTTKPPGQGTGLGLSVTYGIVQAHGGAIEVESRVGQGTTFRVRLPVHQPGHPRSSATASHAEPPPSLLVAEAASRGVCS